MQENEFIHLENCKFIPRRSKDKMYVIVKKFPLG